MDSVPTLFIQSVCERLRFKNAPAIENINGSFGEVARWVCKDNFTVHFAIDYHDDTGFAEYLLYRVPPDENGVEEYEFVPSDFRFIKAFIITLVRLYSAPQTKNTWKPLQQDDPKLLQLLKLPFYYTALEIDAAPNRFNFSKILEMIPEECTFNKISDRGKRCEAMERIVAKSYALHRLTELASHNNYD